MNPARAARASGTLGPRCHPVVGADGDSALAGSRSVGAPSRTRRRSPSALWGPVLCRPRTQTREGLVTPGVSWSLGAARVGKAASAAPVLRVAVRLGDGGTWPESGEGPAGAGVGGSGDTTAGSRGSGSRVESQDAGY
ncbi:hypothetical protein NN561_008800 [Cricetulus griseus]